MTTNHLPIAPADDDAIWDRLVAVPWDTRIPPGERTDVSASLPRDPEVLEYVLSWAVAGAVMWHQERTGWSGAVLQSGIGTPVAVQIATDAWQRRSESASGAGDALTEWLRSDGVVEGDTNDSLPLSLTDLHASHTAWARSVRTHPMTERAFTTALRARGMKKVHTMGGNRWTGVRLLPSQSGLPSPDEP
jgi:phage/plasmid-associated DNA primase